MGTKLFEQGGIKVAEICLEGRVLGLRVGKKHDRVFRGKRVEGEPSAIGKTPVQEALLESEGLRGDEQADRVNHGGIHKAILLFSIDSYQKLALQTGLTFDVENQALLGENLLVEGLNESSICVGDRFLVGEAEIEISQPRQPCWKLSANNDRRDLSLQIYRLGLTGWYARVISGGVIRQNETLKLLSRPHERLTIAALNRLIQDVSKDAPLLSEALACEALSPNFKNALRYCLEHHINTPPAYIHLPS